MNENQKKKVVVAIIYKESKILAVSRKDNHNDFGLPGGKVEVGETLEEALKREIKEETGLDLLHCEMVMRMWEKTDNRKYEIIPYVCIVTGEIKQSEGEGIIKWLDPQTLRTEGSYKEYNDLLLSEIEKRPYYLGYGNSYVKRTF